MIKLGTNILSQTVQRNLGRATSDLSTTSERLSSGLRINKASDDAAGLAIAASLNTDTRIFTQGVRNLNDGLSAANIAEGAMEQLGNIIIRIEELATQSANGTYSDTQRASLQKEATALTAEWNRIVESTSFNGQSLLTGSNTRTVLQGGKGAEGTLAVQIGKEQFAGGAEGNAGGTTRVSINSAGGEPDSNSFASSISADGRYISFESLAENLVAGDSNLSADIFLKDLLTGTTTRVSTDSGGGQGNNTSGASVLSGDASRIAFRSAATNLVSFDTNGANDIFLKNIQTGTTTRISTSSLGVEGDGSSSAPAISADGRYVAFTSLATNLVAGDTNGVSDVFVKDTLTGITTRVSTDGAGSQGNAYSHVGSISADGRYVSFVSDASNLVAGDTNGGLDIFVKDLVTGTTTRVNTSSSGGQSNAPSIEANISADGRFVAFSSLADNLVAGDSNGAYDIFLKDLHTGTITRVNTDSMGTQADSDASETTLSADGRYIAFRTIATNLVPGDTNGARDIFVKDVKSGTTTRVSTNSAGVEGNAGSYTTSISADGRHVSFWSGANNLVPGDVGGGLDVFVKDLSRIGVQQLAGVVVSNKASAKLTLDLAQRYRAELLDYRSKLGATTSRISTFVNTLQSSTINYKAASSRITDADIADESSKSIAAKIRQEVATSLLSQANQAPQIALSLLRGA